MQAEFNGLPLYKAVFPLETDGIIRVSLVDRPAVESDFMFFSKQERVQMYAVADEEKRLVRGVILRADYPIYRNDPHIGEYFIMFDPKEIRELAEKYLYDGRQNRVNLQHQQNAEITGVNLRQMFIKDSENGIAPKGFEDIEEGSLFGEYHVTNDAVWEEIKKGTYKGFSVEIMGVIDPEVFSAQPKKTNYMTIKSIMKKLLVELAAVTTDKGILAWDGEEDLKAGDEVYIEEDGEKKNAPDGDYTTEDGKIIQVAGGKVSDIIDPKAEVAEEETAEELPADEAGTKDDEDELWAMFNDLAKRVEALEAELKASKERAEQMQSEIEKFAAAPAAAPAHEDFAEPEKPKYATRSAANQAGIISAKRK